jgi:NmrA-like family
VNDQTILVVGATGNLGGRVVRELMQRGRHVRALVRDGTPASSLTEQGVEVVRGDLVEPESLEEALVGVGALVTTAAGYTRLTPERPGARGPRRQPQASATSKVAAHWAAPSSLLPRDRRCGQPPRLDASSAARARSAALRVRSMLLGCEADEQRLRSPNHATVPLVLRLDEPFGPRQAPKDSVMSHTSQRSLIA